MIQRNQDQNNIKFFEDAILGKREEKLPEKKSSVDNIPEWKNIKNQKPKKSNNSKAIENYSNKSILSAGQASITDFGGPEKQIKTQTSNSIWDSTILDKLSKSQDNREKTASEKNKIEKYYQSMKQERLDEMVNALKNTETRKNANVNRAAEYTFDSTYKAPSSGISIFDSNKDFDRVPEMTHGEKVAKEARVKREKDTSWKQVSRNNTIQSMEDSFINKLFKK